MKQLIMFALFTISLFPSPVLAEIKTITHTVQQPFGGSQSPDDARTAGIARAKREALEQFGTYIESTTVVKESRVDSDEILALTAGVTKAEVVKQKNYTDGDGFGLEITVKVELDTAVLEKSLKRLLEDRNHLKDLKVAREREKQLLSRIVELEKENQKKGNTKQQSAKLKKEFQAASQGLTAVEYLDKTTELWDGKKYSDPTKAIELLTKALTLSSDDIVTTTTARINRGLAYSSLKLFEQAIADYDEAIRLIPNFSSSHFNRGDAYHDLKQFERALEDYSLAIRFDPNNYSAYVNRGILYSDIKQYDRAIADYSQAIRLDPNIAVIYYNRGNLYYRLKQFVRAIADYDQAVRIDPAGNASAYNNRGIAYLMLNNNQMGCDDLETACKLGNCKRFESAKRDRDCR